jgi:hypothetical protein
MSDDRPVDILSSIPESFVLTGLLDEKDKFFYYEGSWEMAENKDRIFKTGYSVSSGL